MPEISIITPAYNAELYIEQAIISVLNQSYTDFELIIIDDGSIDSTLAIVKRYTSIDNRIKYFYQQNAGQGKARNLGLSAASGNLIAFLDADDYWHPDKLNVQLSCFLNENVDVVYTSGWSFKNESRTDLMSIDVPLGLQNIDRFYIKQLNGYSIPMLSTLVKKKKILEVGGFDEDPKVRNAEDYQLWLKLSDIGARFFGLEDKLFYYRIHPGQSTHSDSLALIPSLWAAKNANLQKITEKEKLSIIRRRLNRYLIHNIETVNRDRVNKILDCYKKILKEHSLYLLLKILYGLSPNILKILGYRFLELREYEYTHN
jgi:teichuronic acid biosynthesis glycosyltransferase TuaG